VNTQKSLILINGGQNGLIRGTYVHELLIPHIASWISPQFGIKISKIVNSFIINEYNNTLKKKETTINSLNEKLQTILQDNKEMKRMLEDNQLRLDKTFDKLVGVNKELIDIKDKLDDTNNKLYIATDDRVVKTKSRSTSEYLIILKTDDIEEAYKYYIIRCQKRSINQQIREKPNYREIKRIRSCPNSNNLFNRIKEKMYDNLEVRVNRLNIKNISEKDFLRKIDEINMEKKII